MNDEPFLKVGHIVHLIINGKEQFHRIMRREPFDFETGEEDSAIFSTVASGSTSGFKNIEQIEPDTDPFHLFQVVMGFRDAGDVKYYVKMPAGQNRFGTDDDKEIGFLNADKSPSYDPNPDFTVYLINGWYPAIDCRNNSPVTITPKVYFKGMKYNTAVITDPTTIKNLQNGAVPYREIIFGGVDNTVY